jgi:hypothetical protein
MIDALDVTFPDPPGVVGDALCELLFEPDEPHPASAIATSAKPSTLNLSRVTTSSLLS